MRMISEESEVEVGRIVVSKESCSPSTMRQESSTGGSRRRDLDMALRREPSFPDRRYGKGEFSLALVNEETHATVGEERGCYILLEAIASYRSLRQPRSAHIYESCVVTDLRQMRGLEGRLLVRRANRGFER